MVTTHNQQINSTKDDLLGNTLLFSDLISKTIWVISYLIVTGLYKSGQGLPSPSRDRDGIGRRDGMWISNCLYCLRISHFPSPHLDMPGLPAIWQAGLGQGLPWRDVIGTGCYCFHCIQAKILKWMLWITGLSQGCVRISNCPFLTRNRVAANITNTSGRDAPFFEFPLIRFKGTKTPCSPLRDCKKHAKFGRLNITLISHT